MESDGVASNIEENSSLIQDKKVNDYTDEPLDSLSTEPKKSPTVRHSPKTYNCEYCGIEFSKKSNCIRHTRIHTGEKAYKCGECTASFTSKGNLKVHIRLHSANKPLNCDLCDAIFAKKIDFVKHQKIHTGYSCDDSFSDHKSHTTPETTHRGRIADTEKEVQDQTKYDEANESHVCVSSVKPEKSLVSYSKPRQLRKPSNMKPKPFQCEICFTRFAQRRTLKRHQTVHSGDRPFQCKFCTASFFQKGSLTVHLRNHPETTEKCSWYNNDSIEVADIDSENHLNDASAHGDEANTNYQAVEKVSANTSKKELVNGVKRGNISENESVKRQKVSEEVAPSNENVFELDAVDPIFSDFIVAMHQKATTGEIATEMLFQ